MSDPINPSHYNSGRIECIESIEASMTPQGFKGFLKGNCIKYLHRYENKNGKWLSDLTIQWFGPKRLPTTQNNPIEYKRENYSPAFYNVNAQLTYILKKKQEWHFYLGVGKW